MLVASVRIRSRAWRRDENGNRVEDIFDPLVQVQAQPKRYALYHVPPAPLVLCDMGPVDVHLAKDGDRTSQPPGVGNGYTFVPFGDPSSDIDFETFFANQGAKGFHNPNYEQDNAPGGSADPGRSLRFTEFSAYNMVNLRG